MGVHMYSCFMPRLYQMATCSLAALQNEVIMATIRTRARHRDQFSVNVSVQVKCITFDSETSLLCMWLKRDFSDDPSTIGGSPVEDSSHFLVSQVKYSSTSVQCSGLCCQSRQLLNSALF